MATLLIVEDEEVLARNMGRFLERGGHDVTVVHDGPSGWTAYGRNQPDMVVLDYQLPGLDGVELVRRIHADNPDVPMVMVTGHGTVSLAVEAMKAGALDILTKPITLEALRVVVERALAQRQQRHLLTYYQERQKSPAGAHGLLGESAAMVPLRQMVTAFAQQEPFDQTPPPPILITGETGTGKEVVARACHQSGPRCNAPFVEVNCAALPANLIEAELFGYEKGAFTDAKSQKAGLFEAAHGGVLFLDELGELDLALQAKLLRVLENFRIRRLGALNDRAVNVRVVAATNQDLAKRVQEGKFRSDLLFRLSVFTLHLPPLRERGDDVLLLAGHFLQQLAPRYGKPVPKLLPDAQDAMRAYAWPGNVRELRNVLERAVLVSGSGSLDAVALGLPAKPIGQDPTPAQPQTLDDVERQLLVQALDQTGWNVTQAAKKLGISRDTLRYRIERHRLQRSPG